MRHCLLLAERALKNGNAPVGAVVIFEDRIIGEGIESGKSSNDITNHAESLAIRDVIHKGHLDLLHKSQMITTHEPCIMCSYLIRHHKIPHIVYGTAVPFIGGVTSKFNILTTEDVPKWGKKPMITDGVCANECDKLTVRFTNEILKSR